MNLMLLAAGEGTRLRPYTLQMPKPKIPFLSVPLAAYSLELMSGISISNLVVNTHHLPEQIEDLFFDLNPPAENLHFSDERSLLLGSGGGIHAAEKYLKSDESFMVCNADEVILPQDHHLMSDLLQFHRSHGGIATLLTKDHPGVGHQFGGAWTLPGKTRVVQFSKTKLSPEQHGHHFVGVMLLHPKIFSYFKPSLEIENILYETLTLAMQQGEEVHVFNRSFDWFETGNSKDFLEATRSCLEILSGAESWKRSYLENLIRKWSSRQVLLEKDAPEILRKMQDVFKARSLFPDEQIS